MTQETQGALGFSAERMRAVKIANWHLDRHDIDPDSDMSVVSRQLTRAHEALEQSNHDPSASLYGEGIDGESPQGVAKPPTGDSKAALKWLITDALDAESDEPHDIRNPFVQGIFYAVDILDEQSIDHIPDTGKMVDVESLKSEMKRFAVEYWRSEPNIFGEGFKNIQSLAVEIIDHLNKQGRIVKEGYVMLPEEPTDEMQDAFNDEECGESQWNGDDGYDVYIHPDKWVKAYKAMIKAGAEE